MASTRVDQLALRSRDAHWGTPGWRPLAVLLGLAVGLSACEDRKKEEPAKPAATADAAAEEANEPSSFDKPVEGPPEFSIDEVSPRVSFKRAVVVTPEGKPNADGLANLRQYLADAKKYIEQSEVTLRVHRQAKPIWVTTYLNELGKLGPSAVYVETETRSEYPSKLKVRPETQLDSPPKCSLVGMILQDRATAIWRLSGGTARKRARGMGGPDLTMTAETIESMAKGCDSELFFATGAPDVEWGLVYDLAASAAALEKAGLKVAAFPSEPAVAGHPVTLAK